MRFELEPTLRGATDAELLKHLIDTARALGKDTLTREEYNEYGPVGSHATFVTRFGSWTEALERAGLRTNRPRRDIPDEELLRDLVYTASSLGRETLTREEYNEHGTVASYAAFVRRFGSWTEALERAGLRTNRPRQDITNEELLRDLVYTANSLSRETLTREEYNEHGTVASHAAFVKRFGSWTQALERAGLQQSRATRGMTDEEILRDVADTASSLGRDTLTKEEYDQHGTFSTNTCQRRFGSWTEALKRAGLRQSRPRRDVTNEELLRDVAETARSLSRDTLTKEEYDQRGTFSTNTCQRRFGSWSKALDLAGLQQSRSRIGITDEELFNNMKDVWLKLGRQPRTGDLQAPTSQYPVGTYKRRFGSLRRALETFVDWVNEEPVTPPPIVNPTLRRDTRRQPSDRLRFTVFMRDGFACTSCGSSPVRTPGVELQADHIVPWSKGGRTVMDNLTTRCKRCNLGKGDMLEV